MFVNRKINHDYILLTKYEAGIQLLGSEVSSLKNGKCSLSGSYCYFVGNELFMNQVQLPVHDKSMFPHDPFRLKKLLLTKKELEDIKKELSSQKGSTVLVGKIFRGTSGKFKALIWLAKGKKDYDKRKSIQERDNKIELNRINKNKI